MTDVVGVNERTRLGVFSDWRGGLSFLTPADKRRAVLSLLASLATAATSSLMIWSLIPFMELAFDVGALDTNRTLVYLNTLLLQPGAYAMLIITGLGCVALILASVFAQLMQMRSVSYFSAELTKSLGERLLALYLAQPYEFFLDRHSSKLSATILSETEAVVGQFYQPALHLIGAVVTTIAIVAVLGTLDAKSVLVLGVVILLVYSAIFFALRRRMKRFGEKRSIANQRRFKDAGEGLQSIKDVKVHGLAEPYLARFSNSSAMLRDATVGSQIYAQMPGVVLRAILLVGGIFFIILFIQKPVFLEGRALDKLAPALGALAIAAQRLTPELQRILECTLQLQFGSSALKRLNDDVSSLASREDHQTVPRIRLRSQLKLKDVSYSYPGSARPGLDGIDLTIRAGEKIGIVGRSGAGKTTLGDIVLGLLEPTRGQMLIDGQPVNSASRSGWRQSVGFVPQDIFLIDASVSENIALGVLDADVNVNRVLESARMASIDAFVSQTLPNAYDTVIGERGIRLSGGQRQRLGIARAVYRDVDLIVFDEATNALDSFTEQEVMDALSNDSDQKTILIIAHRLNTLDLCDRIIVLENGQLAGFGTRREMEQDCPAFQRLLNASEKQRRDVL